MHQSIPSRGNRVIDYGPPKSFPFTAFPVSVPSRGMRVIDTMRFGLINRPMTVSVPSRGMRVIDLTSLIWLMPIIGSVSVPSRGMRVIDLL